VPTVRVNDIDIHYEVTDFTDPWAKPETILLHHGFARNLRFWYRWVPLLCRDYRVITMDSRGCGKTTIPPEGYQFSLDQMGDDALGLMNTLGLERVHWGAEASGGIVGINVAVRHPQRIASLTLCNTPIKLPQTTNDSFVEEDVLKYGTGHWARSSATRRFDIDKLRPGYLEWSIAEHNLTLPRIAVGIHHMLALADSEPVLPRLKAPVLILAGESSKIATIDQVREMEQLIPHAKVVVFKGYSQGIAFSNSDACATEMLAFLKSLPKK